MTNLPGPSFPLAEAVYCADCLVCFSSREVACPKCAAVVGIVPLESTAPGREIARLRDREAMLTAALTQIGNGYHSREFKAGVARKALAYLASETRTATAGTAAAQTKEEVTN